MANPLENESREDRDEIVVPVLAEQLNVDTVAIPVGGVRIIKRVVEEQLPIDEELRSQTAEVERVSVGRYVDGPLPVRQSEDALVVPVVEEHILIERRWFLKEEIHIKRIEQTTRYQDTVTVRHEEATIERLDPEPRSVTFTCENVFVSFTISSITYRQLRSHLSRCIDEEFCMPVQFLYAGIVTTVHNLAYSWAGDGTLLLALDSRDSPRVPLSYRDLLGELNALCFWQLGLNVVVGMANELAEVLTLYHEFDWAQHGGNTLLLVSTPPDEYFDPEIA